MPDTVARRCHRDRETDLEKLGEGEMQASRLQARCVFFTQTLEYTGIKQGAVSLNPGRIPQDFPEICKVKNNTMH